MYRDGDLCADLFSNAVLLGGTIMLAGNVERMTLVSTVSAPQTI